jgi:epoxyqueuosine reductase
MRYMENHFDKRLDPRLLVPGAKSVISVLYNYYPAPEYQQESSSPKISKYAWGEDYHLVIKDKLRAFLEALIAHFGDISARIFVDSAPVMDKVWAAKSGLGWVGKHSNLINKERGSFFFIAEIICDLELEPDGPIKDYCGTCTRCMDACPTEAIPAPYIVDGSKCISYYTIELKGAITGVNSDAFQNWAFGCDICQDVCPWNRFAKSHKEPRFLPQKEVMEMGREAWYEMSKEIFDSLFAKSALQRSGYEGLKRNLRFIGGAEHQPKEG